MGRRRATNAPGEDQQAAWCQLSRQHRPELPAVVRVQGIGVHEEDPFARTPILPSQQPAKAGDGRSRPPAPIGTAMTDGKADGQTA
jgi:hypothetical protein